MLAACNNFTLTGNISQPMELRTTKNGKKFSFISIAVNSGAKDVDFISFIVWDKLAENLLKYCQKGDCISVHGHISAIKNKDNNTVLQLTGDAVTFLHKAAKNSEPEKKAEPEKEDFIAVSQDPFANL